MKILVADDRGVLAPTCIVFLAYWGHEVEVAHDGLEALRKARAWKPDLILAPARLERMDGLSLLAALRAGGLRETEFVMIGTEEDRFAWQRARQLGASAFLDAPLAVADLAAVIARHVRGEVAAARAR